MPARKIEFADLVVCAEGEHTRAFGLAGRAGIVVETRKNDGRVLYLDPECSVWLPLTALRPASPEEAARTPLALAADLAGALQGHTLEASFSPGSPPRLRLVIGHGAVSADLLDGIRSRLAGRIYGWALRPAGMHRMESVIEIRAALI